MFAARNLFLTASAVAKDLFFRYVTMLLPGNGTNGRQNNTFLDSSTNNFTITRNGNTTQGTFSPYGSLWSNYFDGSSDFLSIPNSSALAYGTGSFTIEFWIFGTIANDRMIYDARNAGSTGPQHFTTGGYGGSTPGVFRYVGSSEILTTTLIADNAWHHCAIVRNGSSNITLYVDGVASATGTDTTNYTATSGNALLCANSYGTSSNNFQGYISNFRIAKGTAVYTSNFTPSTTPLTAITNTSLLTCQSNRFIDNSTNNFAITRNGDVSVQRFSPFNPTAPYDASTDGGSGFFDGTGDYLTAPSNAAWAFGTGDFTVEAWIYPRSFAIYEAIASNMQNGSDTTWGFLFNSSGGLRFQSYFIVSLDTNTSTVTLNAWNHVVAVRSGSNGAIFINGTRRANSASFTNNLSTSATLFIGRENPDAAEFDGYISSLRIVKGTAVYDPTASTITVPTSPLTAITNTQLLTNFTNAGIIDNAEMNNLETVGNAQISTAQSKFGGGSISLDGTGDWLIGPASPNLVANGDFTVEAWVYMNANSGSHTVINYSNASGQTQWALLVGSFTSGKASFYWVNSSPTGFFATGTTTIPTGQWVHLAGTRQGTTLRIFVNGVLEGTGTTSGSVRSQSSPLLVVGQSGIGTETFNGYIDDLRVTNGVARYVSSFSVPTAPFPTQ